MFNTYVSLFCSSLRMSVGQPNSWTSSTVRVVDRGGVNLKVTRGHGLWYAQSNFDLQLFVFSVCHTKKININYFYVL